MRGGPRPDVPVRSLLSESERAREGRGQGDREHMGSRAVGAPAPRVGWVENETGAREADAAVDDGYHDEPLEGGPG